MKIKAGQILAITEGEYSDYSLKDHLRALRDFDADVEIKRFGKTGNYLVVHEPASDPRNTPVDESGSDDRFLAWAIREGLIEPLPEDTVVEWWLGSDGELAMPADLCKCNYSNLFDPGRAAGEYPCKYCGAMMKESQ